MPTPTPYDNQRVLDAATPLTPRQQAQRRHARELRARLGRTNRTHIRERVHAVRARQWLIAERLGR